MSTVDWFVKEISEERLTSSRRSSHVCVAVIKDCRSDMHYTVENVIRKWSESVFYQISCLYLSSILDSAGRHWRQRHAAGLSCKYDSTLWRLLINMTLRAECECVRFESRCLLEGIFHFISTHETLHRQRETESAMLEKSCPIFYNVYLVFNCYSSSNDLQFMMLTSLIKAYIKTK